MNECCQYLFLHNNKLKAVESFKDSYLKNGTSLYEVVRLYNGRAIFLFEHYSRLLRSSQKVGLNILYDFTQIEENIQLLVDKNDCKEGNIKLVFNFNSKEKNFYAYFVRHSYPTKLQYQKGVRTIIHQAERPTPTAKVYNHSLRSKTNNLIDEANMFEVLLLNKLGNLTEGSRSNLFFIQNNELYTAPNNEVLNGIVRGKVIEIANQLSIPIHFISIPYEDLPKYDAAFLTGTSPMILPIKRINSLSFSADHPLLSKILSEYRRVVNENLSMDS
ncbi:aminotransferase class IV [Marinifilum sp.]|uniref:aminotransferase class IV n=1 Tax=Marinifilum sp. TaxID=2033137 RepID=UPI003BA985C6